MLSKEHWIFIDTYIRTMDFAVAAQQMGGVSQKEASTVGLDLIRNPEIQAGIKQRREDLINAMNAMPLSKEQILAIMMFQYQKANQANKSKEAVDILAQIAQAQGIDLKTIQAEPINLIINNLDKDKI